MNDYYWRDSLRRAQVEAASLRPIRRLLEHPDFADLQVAATGEYSVRLMPKDIEVVVYAKNLDEVVALALEALK